jgi:cell filamentation protein
MELQVLDPFGDYETAGYLRNVYREKDLRVVGHLETAAFEQEIIPTLRFLEERHILNYEELVEVHSRLFNSVYPWAGQDRSTTAPNIAIAKAGFKTLFAHPKDVRRAAEYALRLGQDTSYLRTRPGEVFGQLAHAHPFLEGNGRTILTIFSDLARRAGFHIGWERIDKEEFLKTLTSELLGPGKGVLDRLVILHMRQGGLSVDRAASRLRVNFSRD